MMIPIINLNHSNLWNNNLHIKLKNNSSNSVANMLDCFTCIPIFLTENMIVGINNMILYKHSPFGIKPANQDINEIIIKVFNILY